MLNNEEKDRIKKQEREDSTLEALNAIAQALTNKGQINGVVESFNELIKVVKGKESDKDVDREALGAMISKFADIEAALIKREGESNKAMLSGFKELIEDQKRFYSQMSESYDRIDKTDFSGLESAVKDLVAQMKVDADAEHEMNVEYYKGNITKVKVKRTK